MPKQDAPLICTSGLTQSTGLAALCGQSQHHDGQLVCHTLHEDGSIAPQEAEKRAPGHADCTALEHTLKSSLLHLPELTQKRRSLSPASLPNRWLWEPSPEIPWALEDLLPARCNAPGLGRHLGLGLQQPLHRGSRLPVIDAQADERPRRPRTGACQRA